MAIFSYNARVDEVALGREQTTVRARTYLPALTSEREAALGRVFGFVELNMLRTPQVDKILAAIDHELIAIYGQGALRPGENQEEYFENALRRIERRIFEVASENRIRLDKENVQLVFGVIAGENIHLAAHGNVFAYFMRRGKGKPVKVIDILSGLNDEIEPNDRLLSSVVSGKMDPDDVILVTNETMSKTVPIADFVQTTTEADPAALGSHLRNMTLQNRPTNPALGLIIRLSASRVQEIKQENPSVKAMLSREEEVARVLEPSSIPKLQNVISKIIASKEKNNKQPFPRLAKKFSSSVFLDKVNQLPRRAKISLLVAITLCGIFFLSAEVISLKKHAINDAALYTASIKKVNDLADEAESSIIYDEIRSANLIASAETEFAKLPDKTKQEKTDRESLKARLDDLTRRLKHIYTAKTAALADLGGTPSTMLALGGTFYVTSGNDLFAINDGKAKSLATFPATTVWSAINGDKLYFMLSNKTLLAFDPKNPIPSSLPYSGPDNSRAGGFWNGRMYVVTSDGTQILKINPSGNGFGSGTPWLKTAVTGKGIATIAVDGSIFSAIPGDAIYDFVKGNRSSFSASGATANLDPKTLFIGNNLYLLGGDGTIAEWTSSGKLSAQYSVPEENGKPTAFTVDEAAKNIYLATDKGKTFVFSIAK